MLPKDSLVSGLARMVRWGWADRGLEEACMQARRTSQCLLPVLLPLLKAATVEAGGQTKIMKRPTPEVREIKGVPSYSLDGYIVRQALVQIARYRVRNLRGGQLILGAGSWFY
jgi:hypothetical protein